jgi:two-component SAPR family response regulator
MDLHIRNIELQKILVILACFIGFSQSVRSQSYGLEFRGIDVSLDRRTELNLTPDKFFKFRNEFEISFDYKAIRITPNSNTGLFGYIFRIINNEDENIDLLSTPTPQLNLVLGKTNQIVPITFTEETIGKWINLRIKFFLSEDKLIFYTPDTSYVQENAGIKKDDLFKILFGGNDYKHFKSSDVPTMAVRDIKIYENGKIKYYWPLDEKEGTNAADRIKGEKALAVNPSWLVLTHQNWQKVFEDEIKGVVSITSDNENGDIFMVGEDQITVFSTQNDKFYRINYRNNPLFFDVNYRAIFNTTDKKIYCYLVDELPYYFLDINTGIWGDSGTPVNFQTKYRHHNSFYRAEDNSIYTFGGYGNHRYRNEIFKIHLTDSTIEALTSDISVFQPRYLSGLGVINDTAYILGGYGSLSGNQLINPHSYFDLIGYSFKTGKLFEKFAIPKLFDDMVVGNKMWIDEQTRDYYTLIFNKVKFENHLQLIKGKIDSPKVDLIGDKIPFKFMDIRSFVNLFYMPFKEKLYTSVSYATDSTTQIAIYSINYPPNKAPDDIEFSSGKINWFIVLIVFAAFLTTGILVFILRKRKKKFNDEQSQEKKEEITGKKNEVTKNRKYNLIFFSGFQVFNKEFKDITNKFSPLLKELFLLIFLSSLKNDKGISSEKITEILWFDKSEKSARNNRSVNIAKLKGILAEIGECGLSKKTGYWKIDLSEVEVKSDYLEFLKITSSPNLNKEKINHLIGITEKGAFLSNLHYEWLDEFKAMVSDRIVDVLIEFGQSINVKDNADFIIHLADSIFNFDVINEEAMVLKCKAQFCMGKHSLAKATYEKFCKEYNTMYGQEYEIEFLDILKS